MISYAAAETAAELAEQVPALGEVASAAEDAGKKLISFDLSSMIPGIINFGVKLLVVFLIWFIGKKLTNLVLRFFEKTAEFNKFDISVTKFLSILIRWIMYFIIACMILNYLNIGTASLIAVLGSAGLAIGMSLQGSLSNFAGSVIILVMKPFHVGDYIVAPAGEGTVKVIGLIYTTLTTVDNREIHIPNGTLSNSNITNVSINPTRLASVKVGISYNADIKKAKELIEDMLRNCEYILPDTEIKVFVSNLGASSVDLEGRCTVATENYWPATWYFTERIKEIFDAEGIEIPFSQLDVHMK
ncbi:MAG: mechanosensitive ion channel [Lachnospiraceae bacterium]|nr:mechanosensitive ion channel [Lachnospiraceae bacterium]